MWIQSLWHAFQQFQPDRSLLIPAQDACLPFFGHHCRKLQRNPLSLPDSSSSTTAADAFAMIVAARGAGDGEGRADAFDGVAMHAAKAATIATKARVPLFAVPPISLIEEHIVSSLLSSVSVVDRLEMHRRRFSAQLSSVRRNRSESPAKFSLRRSQLEVQSVNSRGRGQRRTRTPPKKGR